MSIRLLPLLLSAALAAGASGVVQAQGTRSDSAVLPVWNSRGKLEGVLLLQPADARRAFGQSALDSAFGLGAGDSLGLVCDRPGLTSSIGSLANRCMLAAFDQDGGRAQGSAGIAISRGENRLGLGVSGGRDTLPSWLSPNGRTGQVDENALTLIGQRNLGREATVSIAGSVARARLYPASEIPAEYADRWTTKSLSVGGSIGAFGANIVGRVTEVAGQPGRWEGLGVGITWRTPWSGQLTVGAENIVTRGRNPFAPDTAADDDGTVPYVRYEQDL